MPFLLPHHCLLVSTKWRIRIHAHRIRIKDSTKPAGSPDPYPESGIGPVSTDPDPDPAKPIENTSSIQHTPTIYRSRIDFEAFSVPVPGLSAGSGYPGPDPPQVPLPWIRIRIPVPPIRIRTTGTNISELQLKSPFFYIFLMFLDSFTYLLQFYVRISHKCPSIFFQVRIRVPTYRYRPTRVCSRAPPIYTGSVSGLNIPVRIPAPPRAKFRI